MATKTKAKAANKVKERYKTPKLTCPHIANLTRPHSTESSGNIAQKATDVMAAVESWKEDHHTAFAAGTAESDLPCFPSGKYANPNTGQVSRSAHDKLTDEFNEAIENGTKPPAMLPRYNPALVELIRIMNCKSLRRGSITKLPKPPTNWDEKAFGPWWHEWKDEDGKIVKEPSGWFVDEDMPRRCHAETAEKLIDNPDENILIFGNLRIVCGTGTHDGSAAFIVNQTSHGNYRAGDAARKRMSFAGNKTIRNVVFKIEDRPNNGGGFTVKGKWNEIDEMVYLPGMVLTAGFLYDSDSKQLEAKAIRGLEADTKGLRFRALEAPIIGKAIPWKELWAEIKVADRTAIKKMRERGGRSEDYEPGTVETKAITNMRVHGLRVDPSETFPFGLKGSQCHMVAFLKATGEGKIEDGCFAMGVVIGARANAEYNMNIHEAKGETKATEVAKPNAEKKVAKPKAEKKVAKPKAEKKAAKPKAEKKAAKPKAKPKAEPKAEPTDAAPPVESDTADEKVEVKAVTAEAVTTE